jgi:hypothetical protein
MLPELAANKTAAYASAKHRRASRDKAPAFAPDAECFIRGSMADLPIAIFAARGLNGTDEKDAERFKEGRLQLVRPFLRQNYISLLTGTDAEVIAVRVREVDRAARARD